MKYTRNCPKCNKELSYTRKENLDRAIKNNSTCGKCGLIRKEVFQEISSYNKKCPSCDIVMYYKDQSRLTPAIKANAKCKKCRTYNKPREYPFLERICPQCNVIIKYSNFRSSHCAWKNNTLCKKCKRSNPETIKKLSDAFSGKKNPMYGKTFYQIWLEKYGKEIADQKLEEFGKKKSKANSGKNNPMYGKPSPQGSGNGWSGWYKRWFFRSILELSYIINYVEKNNLTWESGEQEKLRISYIDPLGQERNYYPDFFVDNKYIIECKPIRLHNTPKIICKTKAAIEFCKNNNYIFELLEPKKITTKYMIKLYKKKIIIFTKKYENKFIDRYLNE